MANKPIGTPSDPLVLLQLKILKSQKEYLDSLEESASAYIRKLISHQMDGFEVELSELTQEEKETELRLNQIRAQKNQILETIAKKNQLETGRDQLLHQKAIILLRDLERNGGNIADIKKPAKAIAEGINRKFNGSNTHPVTVEEILQTVIKAAQAEGVEIYGL